MSYTIYKIISMQEYIELNPRFKENIIKASENNSGCLNLLKRKKNCKRIYKTPFIHPGLVNYVMGVNEELELNDLVRLVQKTTTARFTLFEGTLRELNEYAFSYAFRSYSDYNKFVQKVRLKAQNRRRFERKMIESDEN
ncbi:MAG: hypothetical protein ABIC91_07650 [Nanoarchaeota archaeon]